MYAIWIPYILKYYAFTEYLIITRSQSIEFEYIHISKNFFTSTLPILPCVKLSKVYCAKSLTMPLSMCNDTKVVLLMNQSCILQRLDEKT